MKEYVLNLDRPRKLRFDFAAIRALRERYANKDLNGLLNLAVDEMPVFAWAGLLWEDPELTPERVEAMINEKIGSSLTIASVTMTIIEALAAHAGTDTEKKAMSSAERPGKSGSRAKSS